MSFQVKISPRAKAEFEDQLLYLLERSPKGAEAWASEFNSTLASLEDRPEIHGLAPESTDHSIDIFQVIFKAKHGYPYRLLYSIAGAEVLIHSVRGVGQNYTEIE